MNSTIRRTVTAAAVTAAATTALVTGAGAAAAAPAPQTPSLFGPDVRPATRPDCPGTVNVAFDTDPARPGIVSVALTPTGAYGSNPACAADIGVAWLNGIPPFSHIQHITIDSPQPLRVDILSGTGVSLFSIASTFDGGTGVGSYVLAP